MKRITSVSILLLFLVLLTNCSDSGTAQITNQCTMKTKEYSAEVECTFMNEGTAKGGECRFPAIVRKLPDEEYKGKVKTLDELMDDLNRLESQKALPVKTYTNQGYQYFISDQKICSGLVEPGDVIERSAQIFFKDSLDNSVNLYNFCHTSWSYGSPASRFWDGCTWYFKDDLDINIPRD